MVNAMTMWSISVPLSASILIGAGLYQLSPLKHVCLEHCRAPAEYLSRHWRPGRRGAFRMGATHGAYCLGCCWLLMALLFVGGVMNLAWIALLTLLVAGEKLLPGGRVLAIVAGLAFLGWAAWLAFG
jgi:predicted metal-binding membrane protein